eukprot:3615227-Prymnesium_polylepis.1
MYLDTRPVAQTEPRCAPSGPKEFIEASAAAVQKVGGNPPLSRRPHTQQRGRSACGGGVTEGAKGRGESRSERMPRRACGPQR